MKSLDAFAQFIHHQKQKGLRRDLAQDSVCFQSDFTSNDSLQLSQHPILKESAISYLKSYGASISGARLLCKHQALFGDIEHKLASLKQTQDALLFSSGFVTNVSVISALLNKQVLKCAPLVFTDKLVHASIHQGIKLAGAKQIRFQHQNLNHLEQRLQNYADDNRPKFIFVESLYGMQGTITDIKTCAHIAQKHQAFLYVDEAHAFGLYGPKGTGLTTGIQGVDISMGNFSKALGSFGGFVACSSALKEYLQNSAQGFIYSTALPPAVLGAQAAALDMLPYMNDAREKLKTLSDYLTQRLNQLNISMTPTKSHIIGLIFEDVTSASIVHQNLKEAHIATSLIRPPTVPKPLLRISLNIHHTFAQIDSLVAHLQRFCKPKTLGSV